MEKIKDTFGIIISFIIPGFITLMSISSFTFNKLEAVSILEKVEGSIILVLLASIGCGMVVYAYWAILFRAGCYVLRYRTLKPEDIANIEKDKVDMHSLAFENVFRHYQFYGNMTIALLFYSAITFFTASQENYYIFKCLLSFVSAIFCLPISIHSYNSYKIRILSLAGNQP